MLFLRVNPYLLWVSQETNTFCEKHREFLNLAVGGTYSVQIVKAVRVKDWTVPGILQ